MKKLSSIVLCMVLALGFAALVACEQEPEVENFDAAPEMMETDPATGMEAEGEAMQEMGDEMHEMGDEMEETGEEMEEMGEEMGDEAPADEPQQ